MKKRILSIFLLITLILTLLIPSTAFANMAAPTDTDVASVLTFEKTKEVEVLSEVINFVVDDKLCHISATYTMKNKTDSDFSTKSMFISPNINGESGKVTIDKVSIATQKESFNLMHNTSVNASDWRFEVIEGESLSHNEFVIDAITFEIDFAPHEEKEITVSYDYNLGGYPTYSKASSRYGKIQYFLSPANNWDNFSNLTINVHTNKMLPQIDETNIKFEKIAKNHYQFKSEEIPVDTLEIILRPNGIVAFFSMLSSPYFLIMLIPFAIIAILIAIPIIIIVHIRKRKKRLDKNATQTIDKHNL